MIEEESHAGLPVVPFNEEELDEVLDEKEEVEQSGQDLDTRMLIEDFE